MLGTLLPAVLAVLAILAGTSAAACPCSYDTESKEVTCEAGSQTQLPFYLPDCLTPSVDANQVLRLVLAEQNFPVVLIGSFDTFPNLEYLDLSGCNINEVDDFVFEGNQLLTDLVLSKNNLRSLPNLFQSTDNTLESLTARHNQIQSMYGTYLPKLTILDLEDNAMTEKSVASALAPLVNLYDVNLDSNLMEVLTKSTFSSQSNLKVLSLYKNQISSIEVNALDHMYKLRYVDLKRNPAMDYTTSSWRVCQGLDQGDLEIYLNDDGRVIQDLKVDEQTDLYCDSTCTRRIRSVADSCTNDDGHLTCAGNVGHLVCELRETDFKSISFDYPKDEVTRETENFFEAESNQFFRDINKVNGNDSMTKYVKDLKLYGTKFDLTSLDKHLGPGTETVTVNADTIYISRPLFNPIKCKVILRARQVSLTENIAMNMTRSRFFQHLPADQPVENWAKVEEVVIDVGNTSYSVQKYGFVEVQQATHLSLAPADSGKCSPRLFTVEQYQTEHHTSPSVFFDFVQMNLLRMAVRTLASTRSNDRLAFTMVNHTLSKTSKSSLVADEKAYRVAQKLIHDIEILNSHSRNVPFYDVPSMTKFADIMYQEMTLYSVKEKDLMLQLFIALGRLDDMNMIFEEARQQRELYFELEWMTLDAIFTSSQQSWNWTFEASRGMEDSIQEQMRKNQEHMFQMEEEELEGMMSKAEDNVAHMQAVVSKFEDEIVRYTEEANLSKDLQRIKMKQTNEAGDAIKEEHVKLQEQIDQWIIHNILKLIFGFFEALLGIIRGMITFDWTGAMDAISSGAHAAGDIDLITDLFNKIIDIIRLLKQVEDMLNCIFTHKPDDDTDCEWTDPSTHSTHSTKSTKPSGDWFDATTTAPSDIGDLPVSLEGAMIAALFYRASLESAYSMKNYSSAFSDMNGFADNELKNIGPQTDYGVNPAGMQQAINMYASRGKELTAETANFGQLMLKLADLGGELEVAELDLQMATEEVSRIMDRMALLKYQHKFFVADMNKTRDEYQDETDAFADAYEDASAETKEEFKTNITILFDKFKAEFEKSSNEYVGKMNTLTGTLYSKVAQLKQASMTQRSMVMNLYQDFCDGLFYHSFSNCDEEKVPTMSDDFDTILEKLNSLSWDSADWQDDLPGTPQDFQDVVDVYLEDSPIEGFSESDEMHGPVRSLRENHEVLFNFKDHSTYIDLDYMYRIRLDRLVVHLLDAAGDPIPSPAPEANGAIQFIVNFPLEFFDTDKDNNVFSFRSLNMPCLSDYYTVEGEIVQIDDCKQAEEFSGVNHKTSHDGVIRLVPREVPQEILDQVVKIHVTVGGSFIAKN